MEKKLKIRKNNPYYSGRGRPSESAIDWELYENIRENFREVMGEKLETKDSGNVEYGGMLWKANTDIYENGFCVKFSLNYDLNLIPNEHQQ